MAILFPFKPNWKQSVSKSLAYKTDILVSRDKTEQRFAARKQPRVTLEFTTNPVRTDVARAAALLFKDAQGEFVVAETARYARVTSAGSAGLDFIQLADPAPFWVAAGLWVVVETSIGQEALQVESELDGSVVFTDTMVGSISVGAKVHPGLLSRIDQSTKLGLMTSRVSGMPVSFNVDPGVTNYAQQGFPASPNKADGKTYSVVTPLGPTVYFTLAQLGLTPEIVDTGEVPFSVVVHATFKDEDNADMNGYLSAHVTMHHDDGGTPGSTLIGGILDDSGTVTGEGTKSLSFFLLPGTRHVGFNPDVTASIPFYTSTVYSIRNTYYVLPNDDAYQKFYHEIPLFVERPNWSDSLGLTVEGALESVDFNNGVIEYYSYLDWNAIATKGVFTLTDNAKIDRITALFAEMHGQQGEFYAPSWVEDFDVTLGAAVGSYALTCPGVSLFQAYEASEFHKTVIVFFRDGTFQINLVTGLTANPTQSLLTFENKWRQAVNPGNVYVMCWLNRCRFLIDTLELEYLTDSKVTTQLTHKIVKDVP